MGEFLLEGRGQYLRASSYSVPPHGRQYGASSSAFAIRHCSAFVGTKFVRVLAGERHVLLRQVFEVLLVGLRRDVSMFEIS
jgi:hypothetical protein